MLSAKPQKWSNKIKQFVGKSVDQQKLKGLIKALENSLVIICHAEMSYSLKSIDISLF